MRSRVAFRRARLSIAETFAGELCDAVVSYVSRAAEKLRQQQSLARVLQVFAHTNPFKPEQPQYTRVVTLKLPFATDDTLVLSQFAAAAAAEIYREGYAFKKAGTMLLDLEPRALQQATLFDTVSRKPTPPNLMALQTPFVL